MNRTNSSTNRLRWFVDAIQRELESYRGKAQMI
jgi:hypothetical protein